MAVNVDQGRIDSRAGGARLDWSVAQAPKSPDSPSGDGYLLKRTGDQVLLAIVDGVGSGREAHHAADICLKALADCTLHDMNAVFEKCHAKLSGTRGAALALAVVDLARARLDWAAVGDIDGCVLRKNARKSVASMVQRGGTLGHHFPGAHRQHHDLRGGDLIAICTDGISRRYRDAPPAATGPADFASACLTAYGRPNDDRTMAAISFQGGAA